MGGLRRFSEIGPLGTLTGPLFMCHLSVSPVPNLGKTTRSLQSDLTLEGGIEMLKVSDMGEEVVKNHQKSADVLYWGSLYGQSLIPWISESTSKYKKELKASEGEMQVRIDLKVKSTQYKKLAPNALRFTY